MSVFEFPMVFPAGDVSLVGRVFRNVDDLVTPQPAVVVTGAWLTVKEQMPRTYALRLASTCRPAFSNDGSLDPCNSRELDVRVGTLLCRRLTNIYVLATKAQSRMSVYPRHIFRSANL